MIQVIHEVCCGLDVHKASISACLRKSDVSQKEGATYEIREFRTFYKDLLELKAWLAENDCFQIILESTGIYWKPVANVLLPEMDITLANARHVKNLPGKKTDKSDAKWLSDLLAHGLVKPSFIQTSEFQEYKFISRDRLKRVQARSREKNKVHKILEDANIKLTSVISNLFGATGRAILNELAHSKTDPAALSRLAKGSLRKKIPTLELSLQSTFKQYHAYLLSQCLAIINLYDDQIKEMDFILKNMMDKYEREVEQLSSIPGVDEKSALLIISEIGTDMTKFGSAKRLAAWAGVCPGNNESAGKRKTGKTQSGCKYLKSMLIQCAWSARSSKSFLSTKFYRMEARLGRKKTAMAIAHSILVIVYNLLEQGTFYNDEQNKRLQERREETRLKKAMKLLENNGYQVVQNS